MNLQLAIKDNLTATMGFRNKVSGCVTSCGVEYSMYRGVNGFYIFLALKDGSEKKTVHIKLDVLCSAIKKSYLTEYISPLCITEETVEAICKDAEIREKNIEFTSGIGGKIAQTSMKINLCPHETYILTLK